jgi:integrase
MGRTPKPWYRAARDAWYVELGGVQHTLARGRASKAEALKAFHRLMALEGRAEVNPRLTLAEAADLYLDHSQAVHKASTYAANRHRLQAVCDQFGACPVADLKPSRIERWLAGLSCSTATKRAFVVATRAALRWCRTEGHTDADPLAKLKPPPVTRRTRTLTEEERGKLWAAACPAFRDVLLALTESGARPHVLYELEARHCDWPTGIATLPESKGRPYVVILTARLSARLRELAERHPAGPLLRNTRGQPWTRNAVRIQFRRLAGTTGVVGVTAYAYRHSFATDALERGVNPAAVSALLNHSDLGMLSRFYGHLAERRDTLRAAAECAAAPGSAGPASDGRPA